MWWHAAVSVVAGGLKNSTKIASFADRFASSADCRSGLVVDKTWMPD
jgi:hypothetical protein